MRVAPFVTSEQDQARSPQAPSAGRPGSSGGADLRHRLGSPGCGRRRHSVFEVAAGEGPILPVNHCDRICRAAGAAAAAPKPPCSTVTTIRIGCCRRVGHEARYHDGSAWPAGSPFRSCRTRAREVAHHVGRRSARLRGRLDVGPDLFRIVSRYWGAMPIRGGPAAAESSAARSRRASPSPGPCSAHVPPAVGDRRVRDRELQRRDPDVPLADGQVLVVADRPRAGRRRSRSPPARGACARSAAPPAVDRTPRHFGEGRLPAVSPPRSIPVFCPHPPRPAQCCSGDRRRVRAVGVGDAARGCRRSRRKTHAAR